VQERARFQAEGLPGGADVDEPGTGCEHPVDGVGVRGLTSRIGHHPGEVGGHRPVRVGGGRAPVDLGDLDSLVGQGPGEQGHSGGDHPGFGPQ
jgi:hypothetical protein